MVGIELPKQVALERNFFHNQPSALRRSVDFLAERLASNVIRKVRSDDLPCSKC